MKRILTFILGTTPRPFCSGGVPTAGFWSVVAQAAVFAVYGFCLDPGKEPRTSKPEDRATVPGKLKDNLAREIHNLGFKHNRTSHPIPSGSNHQHIAQIAGYAGLANHARRKHSDLCATCGPTLRQHICQDN